MATSNPDTLLGRADAQAKSARVIDAASSEQDRIDSAKPVVLVTDGLTDANFDVIAAWVAQQNAQTPRYVVWRGKVQEIVRDKDAARLRTPRAGELELAIGRDVDFFQRAPDGRLRRRRVDRTLVLDVLGVLADRRILPIVRRQRGVPTFTPDGRLLTVPGLDRESGILLTATLQVTLGKGSPKRARRSLAFLEEEVLEGFHFRGAASRQNYLALMLLVVASDLLDDLSPLGWLAKRRSGEGATALAQILGILLTGGPVPAVAEERGGTFMPAVNAALSLEPPVLILDNVETLADSAALEAWLTTTHHQFRVYSSHDSVRVENTAIKLLTTRKAQVSVDVLRRSLPVFLGKKSLDDQPATERLHQRRQLEDWVRSNRDRIVQALIDIVAAWLKAGRPLYEYPGSYAFPRFASVIGGMLHNVGCDKFLANWKRAMVELDAEGSARKKFITLWWSAYGDGPVKAADLLPLITENGITLDPGKPSAGTTKHSLGRLLSRMANDVIDGYCIEDRGIFSHSHSYGLRKVAED